VAAPLDGVRVLEMTSWMAAPSAAAMLADLGADVVKLEPPSGDALRGMGRPAKHETAAEVDHPFQACNRGKRSITVALDQPGGPELVHRLVADVDIFMCNVIVPRQERYGIGPSDLFAFNNRLVHATLSGYGRSGPDAERPGYDVTAFWGRGGIADSMIAPGTEPVTTPAAMGDYTTGIAFVASILAALRMVEQTGDPQVVDTSLMATSVWVHSTDLAAALVDRYEPRKRTRHQALTPLVNKYPTADGRWINCNMPQAHFWPKFCRIIGREDWLDDPGLQTPKQKFDRMEDLVDGIDEVMLTRTSAEWGQEFDAAGLIWGPAQTIVDLVDDPHARAVGMFSAVDHPTGSFDTTTVPIRIEGSTIGPRGPAPAKGEHTHEILSNAGFSAAEIAKLRADGVLGAPDEQSE